MRSYKQMLSVCGRKEVMEDLGLRPFDLQEIQDLSGGFDSFNLAYIGREVNELAHLVCC